MIRQAHRLPLDRVAPTDSQPLMSQKVKFIVPFGQSSLAHFS